MLFFNIFVVLLSILHFSSTFDIKYEGSDRISEDTAWNLKEYLGETYGAVLVRPASIGPGLLIVTAEEHLDLEEINEQIQRWVSLRTQITTRRNDNVWALHIDQEETGNEAVEVEEEDVDNGRGESPQTEEQSRTSSGNQQTQQGSADHRDENTNERIPTDETEPPIYLKDLTQEKLLSVEDKLGPDFENGGQQQIVLMELDPFDIMGLPEEFHKVLGVGEQRQRSEPQYENLQRDDSDLRNGAQMGPREMEPYEIIGHREEFYDVHSRVRDQTFKSVPLFENLQRDSAFQPTDQTDGNTNEGISPDENQPPVYNHYSPEVLLPNAAQLGPNRDVRETEHGGQNGAQQGDPGKMDSRQLMDHTEEFDNVNRVGDQRLAGWSQSNIPRRDVFREQRPGTDVKSRTSSSHQQQQHGSADQMVENTNERIPPDETQPPIHLQDLSLEELLRIVAQLGPRQSREIEPSQLKVPSDVEQAHTPVPQNENLPRVLPDLRQAEHDGQHGAQRQRNSRERVLQHFREHPEQYENIQMAIELHMLTSESNLRNQQREILDLLSFYINCIGLLLCLFIALLIYNQYIKIQQNCIDSHGNDKNRDGDSSSKVKTGK